MNHSNTNVISDQFALRNLYTGLWRDKVINRFKNLFSLNSLFKNS